MVTSFVMKLCQMYLTTCNFTVQNRDLNSFTTNFRPIEMELMKINLQVVLTISLLGINIVRISGSCMF